MLLTADSIPQLAFAKTPDALLPAVVQHATDGRVLMLGYVSADSLHQTFASGHITFFSRSKNRLWTKGESSGHFLKLVLAKADCDLDSLLLLALPTGPTCHTGEDTCFDDNQHRSDAFNHATLPHLAQASAKTLDITPADQHFSTVDTSTASAKTPVITPADQHFSTVDTNKASAKTPVITPADQHLSAFDAGTASAKTSPVLHDDSPIAAPELAFLAHLENLLHSRQADANSDSYTSRLLAKGVMKVAQKVGEEGVEMALEAVGGTDQLFTEEAADLMYHYLLLLRAKGQRLADVVRVLEGRH